MSAAQHWFNIIKDGQLGLDAVQLLATMHGAGLVDLKERVETPQGELTLRRAILTRAEAGRCAPSFYTPTMAQRLLELDRKFFCQPYGASGGWWVEHTLNAWTRHEDRERLGFSRYYLPTIDQWAQIVVNSLPEYQKSCPILWKACLKLGLKATSQTLAGFQAQGWATKDEKGKPALASAEGAWAWTQALEAGLDPYASFGKEGAFWRAMLPKASSSDAENGSVRQAVEQWVRQEIKKPDSDPELLRYIKLHTLARTKTTMSNGSWGRMSHKEQANYVSVLPAQWVEWERDGIPLWMTIAQHRDANKRQWVEQIEKNRSWISKIKKDPVAYLGLEILRAMPKLPDRLPDDLDVPAAMKSPRMEVMWACCARMSKVEPAQMKAWMEGLSLQAHTAPTHKTRPGPRL